MGLNLVVCCLYVHELRQPLCEWFLSSCFQFSTQNQNPQSCRDQTLCNSPFLLPSNPIRTENSTTLDRGWEMEKKKQTNKVFGKLPCKKKWIWEWKKKKLSIMKSGILMMMMMCCFGLSPPPHSDDMLRVVSTCLPSCYTVSAWPACSLEQITELCTERRIKTSSRVAGPCPMQSLCGQRWKIIPHTKTDRGFFAVVPPVDRNPRSRNAWGLGHGWARNRSQCVDRSVQLVLIPVHAYNCCCYFQEWLLACDVQ